MNHFSNTIAERDIASLIHPYTNLDAHRSTGPLVITRGDGVFVEAADGGATWKAWPGLWSASLGFSEKRLAAAATHQMETLPYYQIFGGRSHNPAIDLAEKLLDDRAGRSGPRAVASSGSEANDQAVKLVWYYHNAIGKPRKKKIIARVRGYHGVTLYTAGFDRQPGQPRRFRPAARRRAAHRLPRAITCTASKARPKRRSSSGSSATLKT